MSSKIKIANRPSHRLFAVTKVEGQSKASWLEIGAASCRRRAHARRPNKDGKGYSLKLKAMPLPGAEIVLRIVEPFPGLLRAPGSDASADKGRLPP